VSQRRDVAFVMTKYGYRERRACRLLEMDRSSYRYQPEADRNAALREQSWFSWHARSHATDTGVCMSCCAGGGIR